MVEPRGSSPEFEKAFADMLHKSGVAADIKARNGQLHPEQNTPYKPDFDNGVNNITATGDLSAKAFTDAAEEAAGRCRAAAMAVRAIAAEIERQAEDFAVRIHKMGVEHSKSVLDFAELTKQVAVAMTETRKLVEGKGE